MSKTRMRTALVALAAGAVISSLTGCSISRDEPDASPGTSTEEPAATEEPTADATPEPTATVTVTPSAEPTPAATKTPAPAATPQAALLSAAEMPRLNPGSKWTQRRTGPAGQEPFGLCQKFDLLTIGALTAVERTYASGKDTAGQQVAEFPDAKNAMRASKVVEAWQRDCAGRVEGQGVKVRPITDVAVPHGKGWSYLVTYERAGAGQVHSLGAVLSGTRMSLVRIDHAGQDHNYAPGKDPVQLAVKAVSAKLG